MNRTILSIDEIKNLLQKNYTILTIKPTNKYILLNKKYVVIMRQEYGLIKSLIYIDSVPTEFMNYIGIKYI